MLGQNYLINGRQTFKFNLIHLRKPKRDIHLLCVGQLIKRILFGDDSFLPSAAFGFCGSPPSWPSSPILVLYDRPCLVAL